MDEYLQSLCDEDKDGDALVMPSEANWFERFTEQ